MTDKELEILWESMLSQSFQPYQWFLDDGRPQPDFTMEGGKIMWVYRKVDGNRPWVVGYYSPEGEWFEDSCWASQEDACARIRWLNGGNTGG